MSETDTLANFVVSTSYEDLPKDAVSKAKEAIRDIVGVMVYGSQHEVGEIIADYVDAGLPGTDATVLGRGRASTPGAALANGTFAHAIDYDDTFESIVLHPSGPVFGAALAAGDTTDATGADVLTSYVVGVEAAYRVGQSTYPSHYDHGWHCTGTAGSFGSCAAAASVLELSADETAHAFGVVASLSSALKKNFGSMTKPLHPGHAAQMGVRAALLARAGFTGDEAILDGKMGYGNVMTPDGSYDSTEITDKLGETWAIHDIGYKPYPSGVITHAAMDTLRDLAVDELSPENVERVTVTLEEAASEMLIHADAANALQAKFSIEFCLAAILREGHAGVHEFTDDYVNEPETRAAMELVERDFEEDLFGDEFAGYGARIVVKTKDDERYTAEERRAPGSPSNPISDTRLREKFAACTQTVLSAQESDELLTVIDSFETDDALEKLADITT